MSLIAFATNGKSADLLTDTSVYSATGARMKHGTKVNALPHIDAAGLSQGACSFGLRVNALADELSKGAPDFDAFVSGVPEIARDAWEMAVRREPNPSSSAFFAVGWSGERGAFAAFGFDSDGGFEPWRVDGLFVHPSPLDVRPSDLELRRMELDGRFDPADIAYLKTRPTPVAPKTRPQWVQLGLEARKRALCPAPFKVFVTGKMLHTHIERGEVRTKLVHTFNDAGQEWQQVVAGTMHPQAQLAPCPCGRGPRMLDCCIAAAANDPCSCGSGEKLSDCCMLVVADVKADAS